MNRLLLLFITPAFFFAACGESRKEEKEKKDYYPIAGYIRGQLTYLDSMLTGILHYRTQGDSTDSLVIEKGVFRNTIGADFITSDISSPGKMKDYQETTFIDAGMGTMTLVYTPESDTLPVRKIDVLLSMASADVYTVYVERVLPAGDTVLQKMLWTHNKNCQVISIIKKPGEEEQVIIDRYVWDR